MSDSSFLPSLHLQSCLLWFLSVPVVPQNLYLFLMISFILSYSSVPFLSGVFLSLLLCWSCVCSTTEKKLLSVHSGFQSEARTETHKMKLEETPQYEEREKR